MPNIFKHWKSVGICNGHFSLLGRKMKLYCSFLGRCQDITQKISKHLLTNIYIYQKTKVPTTQFRHIISSFQIYRRFTWFSIQIMVSPWYPQWISVNADVTTRHGATNLDRRGFSDEECCDKKCLRPLWTCLPRRSNWCINIYYNY